MSIESLLLVALLIVFPLLERLSRYLRARAAQIPADPVGARPPQRAPVPASRPTPPGAPLPQRAPGPEGADLPAEGSATRETAPKLERVAPESAVVSGRTADASGAPGPTVRPVTAPPPVPGQPALPSRYRAPARLTASDRVRAARTVPAEPAALERARSTPARTRHAGLLRGGRANLRRAVVLMTVLGPCKALENEAGRH